MDGKTAQGLKAGLFWLWDALVLSKQDKFGEDFAIEPGRGYVVKVGQSHEFSP